MTPQFMPIIIMSEYGLIDHPMVLVIGIDFKLIIPTFFVEKKGMMCYRSVCPSARPSVRQQFTSMSSYTIDARITKLICMIPLCLQMVATYLKFFYYFQF